MTNLTSAGIAASENFDGLAATGTTASTLPSGWTFAEIGTKQDTTYSVGTGSGNAGDTYSFGAVGSSDRAFGTLQSGSLTPTIGAMITNETGAAITSLLIGYTGEQWRLGTAGREDRLDFQISFDATSLTTGTWVDVNALDFVAPVNAGTLGLVDGNAAANRSAVSATVALDAAIASGATFWIRWTDFNATGADDGLAIDDFSITANPGPVGPEGPGTFSIAGGSAAEGAGFVDLTVTRVGGAAGAATLDYQVSGGTAIAADFDGGVLPNGQVAFADGQTEATIRIAVANDAVTEPDETFTVTLANATAGTIATAAAGGKILNDDAQQLAIYQIQGQAHKSTYAGQDVTTTGVVTAVASNGFYLQDKAGDGNALTSDAIFVFTSKAPSVLVGNEATVTGAVAEFLPGNNATNLTVTQISATAVSVATDGNGVATVQALPEAIVIGTGGLLPPADVFDNDQFAVYDPQNDAADFFESLEGMRVTVDAPIVVDRTNSFGETYVVASGGAGATGLNDRGGMTISGNADGFDDYNPERIQLDDSTLSNFKGKFTQGDELSDVTGIINYDFQSYELLVTDAVTVTKDVPEPAREVTALVGDATHLTMANYNVENLDPGDGARFGILANDIVNYLLAPDVIALQEIQDADGAGNGANLSGYVTAQSLIDAIKAIGGPDYVYVEITPTVAGQTGGEPGGNIRNGFLYNAGRVDYVDGSAELVTGAAFNNSRNPLAATFEFNGQEVTAISVHSSSRGGSDALFGAIQPPVNGAEAARIGQSEAIRDYVQNLVGADTEARIAVLGDFNGFYFEQSLELLEAGGLLSNLHRTLPEEERYSYMFGSNAQALDNFLVSGSLLQNAQFDAVHINAEQADTAARGTDHDPLIASFAIAAEATIDVDLSQYIRVGRFDLPIADASAPAGSDLAREASAITYNWDRDTLFVVGDGTTSIVEISKTGAYIGSMSLAGGAFDDIEGLAYVGNGQFVMVEERTRSVVRFDYTAGGTLVRADTEVVQLGTTTGNTGLEGVTYDPVTGGYIFVKESGPEGIFQTTVDFAAGTASNGSATTANSANLFDPALLALNDLADVFALSNLSTIGTSERGNLLVLGQESGKILEVDRQGNILSSLTIVGDPGNDAIQQQHEGVAMDREGNLYVVSENGGGGTDKPQLWVYKASDVPNAAPTAINLANAATEIAENTSTTTRLKVADITVTDDQLGTNMFSVTGTDAQYFEADSTGLYIKAGTTLDYETKNSFSVTVQVDDATVGGTPDATVAYTLALKDVANEGGGGNTKLFVSEVAPWSSGNSPFKADWFEVTNGGTTAVNIGGWKVDDSSNDFSKALTLNGISSIDAGESVIFLESTTPETTIAAFIDTWFGGTAPAGLQFGTYTGSGIGLSTDGDAVNLYDTSGTRQAAVTFGAADATVPYATFSNAAGLNNADISTLSVVGTDGAFTAVKDSNEIGSPGMVAATGGIVVSEVAPWSNDNSPFKADWFELTNTSTVAIDIAGWKVDDNSKDFTKALALSGVTTIGAGESVIFIESASPTITTQFIDTWFGGNAPAGLQIGTYTGSGIGLSAGGDQVNIYDASGTLKADVAFGAADSTAPYATFDNTAGLNGATLTALSTPGTNGAFVAVKDANETGSPGNVLPVAPTNQAPTAVALTNATTSLVENIVTTDRIKVADVNVTDDGLGTNQLAVTGVDAKYFEVDATGLYIKAGATLDYEAQQSYSVTVTADDTTVGATPDASTSYKLDLVNVNEAPTAVALTNATSSIAENTSTAARIKVADVTVTDDSLGTNQLAVTGADAKYFEVDGTGLYIKAGTTLDYETQQSYSVTVTADDQTIGTTVEASTNYKLDLTDVNETPTTPPATPNQAPIARGDAVAVYENAATANLWAQLLGNDVDPEGGPLRISAVNTSGTLGSIQFDAATQTLRYVADHASFDPLGTGAQASDSFSYTVADAQGATSTATVQVSVAGVGDTSDLYLSTGALLTGLTFGGGVYGSTGIEGVAYLPGVTGAVIDQNVESVQLAATANSFKYQQQGNNLVVFDNQGTTEVARIVLQDDADGTTIRFSDGAFQATVSELGMKIGAFAVSAAAPAALPTAVSASWSVELLEVSSFADVQTVHDLSFISQSPF